ncbi:hypothetical protein [Pukyongiella litopenaei]|uniref:Uncharacterized protein n=1 Tax=Pukyongiella litopenaei TaxID=2605946 RepID=A0A5C2H7F1_9RHOB|nr:hypothetical protein [Pukyongiella litopenaei]QEP30301.1 hypothetical protein C6Y53_18900 [Pukyongiella litopenaei]
MSETWSTADYALIVSLGSATISLFSLGWNVWSKFIYPKPPVRMSIGTSMALGGQGKTVNHLEIQNLGFVPVRITQVFGEIEQRDRNGKKQICIPRFYTNWPIDSVGMAIGTGGPMLLEAGSAKNLYLVESPEDFRSVTRFAAKDGFGRTHYVPKQKMTPFRKYYRLKQ